MIFEWLLLRDFIETERIPGSASRVKTRCSIVFVQQDTNNVLDEQHNTSIGV